MKYSSISKTSSKNQKRMLFSCIFFLIYLIFFIRIFSQIFVLQRSKIGKHSQVQLLFIPSTNSWPQSKLKKDNNFLCIFIMEGNKNEFPLFKIYIIFSLNHQTITRPIYLIDTYLFVKIIIFLIFLCIECVSNPLYSMIHDAMLQGQLLDQVQEKVPETTRNLVPLCLCHRLSVVTLLPSPPSLLLTLRQTRSSGQGESIFFLVTW